MPTMPTMLTNMMSRMKSPKILFAGKGRWMGSDTSSSPAPKNPSPKRNGSVPSAGTGVLAQPRHTPRYARALAMTAIVPSTGGCARIDPRVSTAETPAEIAKTRNTAGA